MGQAKRRGTYDERRTAAIIRDGIEWEARRKKEMKRRSAMIEALRQRERDSKETWATLLATCLSIGVLPYFIEPTRPAR